MGDRADLRHPVLGQAGLHLRVDHACAACAARGMGAATLQLARSSHSGLWHTLFLPYRAKLARRQGAPTHCAKTPLDPGAGESLAPLFNTGRPAHLRSCEFAPGCTSKAAPREPDPEAEG